MNGGTFIRQREPKPSLYLNYLNVSCLYEHTDEWVWKTKFFILACVDITLWMYNADSTFIMPSVQLKNSSEKLKN